MTSRHCDNRKLIQMALGQEVHATASVEDGNMHAGNKK